MMGAMKGSVLVVDDDPAFRRLAPRILEPFGLAVAGEADTAAAAISAAGLLRPDVVLVDVGLPDRDGVALARELSALPWRPRVVLTSSDAEAATASEVRSCGATAFVPKDELPAAPLDLEGAGPLGPRDPALGSRVVVLRAQPTGADEQQRDGGRAIDEQLSAAELRHDPDPGPGVRACGARLVSASLRDAKAVESLGLLGDDLDPGHPGVARALAAEVDELIDGLRLPLEYRLDGAVGAVRRPPRDPQRLRATPHAVAKEHALHPAVDYDSSAHHERGPARRGNGYSSSS